MHNHTLEITSIVASVVGAILAVVAIAQAVYFYTQAKGSEARVDNALVGIKTQTEALQTLSGRQLDRLTGHVIARREEPRELALALVSALRSSNDGIPQRLTLPPQNSTAQGEALLAEIVQLYVGLWNYTAMTNVMAGLNLPVIQEFNEESHLHQIIRNTINRSAADFHFMTSIVERLTQEDIQALPPSYGELYSEVQTHLRELVGDTAQYFLRLSQQRDT